MANTLNLFRKGAVGFIDWLDAAARNPLGYGRGTGLGRGLGDGESLGVGVGLGVVVTVGVGVGVAENAQYLPPLSKVVK